MVLLSTNVDISIPGAGTNPENFLVHKSAVFLVSTTKKKSKRHLYHQTLNRHRWKFFHCIQFKVFIIQSFYLPTSSYKREITPNDLEISQKLFLSLLPNNYCFEMHGIFLLPIMHYFFLLSSCVLMPSHVTHEQIVSSSPFPENINPNLHLASPTHFH